MNKKYKWANFVLCHQLDVQLVVFSLILQISDLMIEYQVMRVNRNFFKDPGPTID